MITHIYIPCEIFEVEATIGPRDRLSPLELLLLEAVGAGVSTFEDLVDLFHLGRRPTIDLILDLWRRGYIIVDPHSGSVLISDRVRECLGPGGKLQPDGFVTLDGRQIEPLHGVERTVRKFLLQQELLSPQGHVLRMHRRPPRVEGIRVAPTALAGGSLRRAPRQEIVGIIEHLLTPERRPRSPEEEEAHAGPNQRVLAVNFSGDPTRPEEVPRESRYLEVRIDYLIDTATDTLAFRVLHPTSLPRRVCADMERSLADLADKLPDHPFFRTLRQQAVFGEIAGVPDLGAVLASLSADVCRLESAEAGTAEARHDDLDEQAAEAQEMVRDYLAGQARIRFRTIAQDIQVEVEQTILDAREQLLLCGPAIDYDALARLQPYLIQALDRGVRVFILWGQRDDARLPQNVVNRLADLTARYGDRLVFSTEPARLGVRFVVKDADRVILSSHQFLRSTAGSFRELAVVVDSPSPEIPLQAALDLLEYGRAGYPTSLVTSGMTTVPERFLSPRYTERQLNVPTSPESPGISSSNDRYSPVALQIWRQSWGRHVKDLEHTVVRAGLTCRVLRDRDHREVLWGLLRRPGRRLVIFSRHLEPTVVTQAMGDLLEQRLSGGTRVVIGFSQVERGALVILEGLERRYHGRLQLIELKGEVPTGDIEALVGDDLAIVSSYPFLSVSGYYDSRRRTRSEVGLLLHGGDVPERLLKELCRRFPALAALAREVPDVPQPPSLELQASPTSNPDVQGLLARIGKDNRGVQRSPQDRARLLRQYFETLPPGTSAGEALKMLDEGGVPDAPMVAACCLATRSWDEPGVRHGLVTIIRHDWYERSDPYTALILLPFLDAPPADLPPLWVAKLKAARRRPAMLEEWLDQATMMGDLGRHAASFACAAISALLLDGMKLAGPAIELNLDRFPAPLASWAEAAIHYHRATEGRALPLAKLRVIFQRQQEREAAQLVRTQLQQALAMARAAHFRFPLGQHTWDFLFSEVGAMGRLEWSVGQANYPQVQEWLKGNHDVDQVLDGATDAIWRERYRDRRIFHPKRAPLVGRLRAVVDRARDWVGRCTVLEHADEEDPFSADLVRLARLLQQDRDAVAELQQIARQDRRPEAPLLAELIDDLRPLLEVPR